MQKDPYFNRMQDYQSGNFLRRGALSQYWESMQRTYGALKGVPVREDPSFKKALEHRTREKEYYGSLELENTQMRQYMQLNTQSLQGLQAENSRLYDLISSFQVLQEQHEPAVDSRRDSGSRVHFAPEVQATDAGGERRPDEPSGHGEDHIAASEGDGADEPEGQS